MIKNYDWKIFPELKVKIPGKSDFDLGLCEFLEWE